MKKPSSKIAIIGFGNMGQAIYSGLIGSGNFVSDDFLLSNSKNDNKKVVKRADIVIFAVKPGNLFDVLDDVKSFLSEEKLLISVVARTSICDIQKHLGFSCQIVRVMPNICASVCESMSCWVKSDEVNTSNAEKVKFILESFGKAIMLDDEDLFGVVTVISGSGPAFFLYLAELLDNFSGGVGLDPKISKELIEQTVYGVSKLLLESDKTIDSLREEITSKGGTTEAVFQKLNENKFGTNFIKALKTGYKRASSK